MATVSASYDAVVLGVSQQVPSKRLSGQHWAQDDFVSDPVRGLRRRPGARRVAEAVVNGGLADISTNFRNFDLLADDRYVSMLCRRPGRTGSAQAVFAFQRGPYAGTPDGTMIAVNTDTTTNTLLAGGVNAVVAVGDYFVFAHTSPVGSSKTEHYDTATNKRRAVFSVKAGTYSRTYTVRFRRTGGPAVSVSYTVPNLYQADGAIGPTSAAAAQPAAIAEQLRLLLVAHADAANFTVTRRGSSLLVRSTSTDLDYAEAADGGDNTQFTATWRVVQDPAALPPTAEAGHVVQVRPTTQDITYYLRAEADSAEPEKVVWREYTAATVALVNPFCIGRIYNNTLYIRSSPAVLQGALDGAGAGLTVPTIAERRVGDDDSMPAPHFVGREITELRVYQERLLVCSGPVVNASQISDFFNFWRTTVLTYPDDDSVEMYATGSEADTIRSSVVFDRSVVFFGDQQQYAISGKVPLTGSTATIMQSSAHRDASAVRPVALGDLLFFIKSGRAYGTAYQIAVGNVEDTSNSTEISRQLHDYLQGQSVEAAGISMPETLLIRTSTPNTLYTFAYMDGPDRGRLFDSWSRWTFDAGCGQLAGVSMWKDSPRVYFVRSQGGTLRLSVNEIDLTDTSDTLPHLDSWYYHGTFAVSGDEHCAFAGDAAPERRWFGREDADVAALNAEFGTEPEHLVLGYPVGGLVRLTSPQVMSQDGKPTANGRLVVTAVVLDLANSGGMLATTELDWGNQPGLSWNGRILGQPGNLVARRTLRDDSPSVFIGQDATNYVLRIQAVDWRPLTITGVHWKGQYFKRTRSV